MDLDQLSQAENKARFKVQDILDAFNSELRNFNPEWNDYAKRLHSDFIYRTHLKKVEDYLEKEFPSTGNHPVQGIKPTELDMGYSYRFIVRSKVKDLLDEFLIRQKDFDNNLKIQ